MIKKYSLILISLIAIFSCSPKQEPINDLENLANRLENSSTTYSEEDWMLVYQDMEDINQRIDRYNSQYTEEELKKINRLKGACLAKIAKKAYNDTSRQIEEAIKSSPDIIKGFIDELDNEQNYDE